MTDETTICRVCGNPMLVRTGEKHDGRCVPCAKGYRHEIENGKKYYEELRKLEKHPSTLFWSSLVERVTHPALGFRSIPNNEKLYFAVCILDGEIWNGGFEQYFTNSSADYFAYAVRGLEKMGAEIGVELTLKAKRLLFADTDVPPHEERLKYLEKTKALENQETSKLLDELDKEYWEHSEKQLSLQLTAFALDCGFWEGD